MQNHSEEQPQFFSFPLSFFRLPSASPPVPYLFERAEIHNQVCDRGRENAQPRKEEKTMPCVARAERKAYVHSPEARYERSNHQDKRNDGQFFHYYIHVVRYDARERLHDAADNP